MPVLKDDSHSTSRDDDFSHGDRATDPDKFTESVSFSSECHASLIDTASTLVQKEPIEQSSPTNRIDVDYKHQLYCNDKRDEPPALPDCVATATNVNTSGVDEYGKILTLSSFDNTISGSEVAVVVSSGCLSVSMSHSSPDSGVYSKTVSNSITTSQSVAAESLDATTDLLKSCDDGSFGLNVLSAQNVEISDGGSLGIGLQDQTVCDETLLACETLPTKSHKSIDVKTDLLKSSDDRSFGLNVLSVQNTDISDGGSSGIGPHDQTVCETLRTCTGVEQSTYVDADDQSTVMDVRSSIMSAGTDDETDRTVVGNDEEFSGEVANANATSPHQADNEEVNEDVRLTADQLVSCLGLQEPSDSEGEDDAVLKTVIAVRTKAAINVHTKAAVDSEQCSDLIKPFEPDEEDSDVANPQSTSGSIQSSPGGIPNMDNSLTECSDLQSSVNDRIVSNLHDESAADVKSTGIEADLVDDRNAIESSPATIEQFSTMSTELDQYMAEHVPQADTSIDSQTFANDSRHLLDLMATVKIFSEDDEPRNDYSGRISHSRTRSFTRANSSLPASRSGSPEFADRSETRWHSSSLSNPQPSDTGEQLVDLNLTGKWQVNWTVTNPEIRLTASMVDLKLRPSRKKLEFDGLPPESSPSFFLEPPDEYRDDPMSTESSISPNVTDLCTDAAGSSAALNMQAKQDHLRRYLESLAAMPGCDSVHDVLDCDQDGKICSQDVSSGCMFGGEDGVEVPYHECSTSLLIPDLLHWSNNASNFTDDEYLEMQLQQYEIMKRQLMEEHRRSLEHLLQEQERQMSLLSSQMMGPATFCVSSRNTSTARIPNALDTANGDYERIKDKSLPADVPEMLDRWNFSSEKQITSHNAVSVDQQNISNPDKRVSASVVGETSSDHKVRSPAGVFYGDEQVVIRQPSCSTIRSDDTESEFAYESPAVLRRSRRLTPTCSPRDVNKTLLDQSHHSMVPVPNNHPYTSVTLGHSTVQARQPSRRYVDMFSEASLEDFNI